MKSKVKAERINPYELLILGMSGTIILLMVTLSLLNLI